MSSSPLDHRDTRTSEGVLTIGMVGEGGRERVGDGEGGCE